MSRPQTFKNVFASDYDLIQSEDNKHVVYFDFNFKITLSCNEGHASTLVCCVRDDLKVFLCMMSSAFL